MRRLTSVQHAVLLASGMSSHCCQKNKGNLAKNIVFVRKLVSHSKLDRNLKK